ncbi:DUF6708 domain-containing protein [Pseudomonas sp. NPDC012596]|uniref:DUF6708 domain-containing protein n=1 Tax=Pseudomonas sp. NPDC012596 TaxID=3364419 RepID=UPI003685E189
MYLIEWNWWKMQTTSANSREESEEMKLPQGRLTGNDWYESDLEDVHFRGVSTKPNPPTPLFKFNNTYMEIRCGGSEEKRGLITIMTLGGICPMIYTINLMAIGFAYLDLTEPHLSSVATILLTLFMIALSSTINYLYIRYGFQITRLEAFTSRHLLIRFNRKNQQVYLHRPKSCGGIVTLPWRTTGSSAVNHRDDHASLGMRQILHWHPALTGLPHCEMAMIGNQGNGGSELRDQWEFIRRYMEEGPDAVPRPRLSTQLPSPIQAFSAQFEGMSRFLRNSSWLFKVILLMVWPAFVILGTAHWVSLMLCWRPRWPKVIREAGLPGKPVPPLTTLADYPPDVQERLLANADRWQLKPGKRPDKKPRSPRARSAKKDASSV